MGMYDLTDYDDRAEYEELMSAVEGARLNGRGDLVVLFEAEYNARSRLARELCSLRDEAERLATAAHQVKSRVDVQGLTYRPNSLGEVQDAHRVDALCAAVYVAGDALASVQRQVRVAQGREPADTFNPKLAEPTWEAS